jgi:hypothetical protein
MKHLIVVLAILCSIGGFEPLSAQALLITPGDTVIYTASLTNMNTNSSGVAQFCSIVNKSGQNDTVCWKIAQLTINPGWGSMSLCDINECYLFYGDVTNGTTHQFPLAADSAASVDVTSTPQCVADTGYLQALFWLKHDSAASATYLVYIPIYSGSCATAIQQVQDNQLKIYPIPASTDFTIEGLQNATNVQISVYDILGNVVLHKTIAQPANYVSISTAGLISGVYILSVESDGVKLLTRRIEKMD